MSLLPPAAAAYSATLADFYCGTEDRAGPSCGAVDSWTGAVCSRSRHDPTLIHRDDSDDQTIIQWSDKPVLVVPPDDE